jgi:cobalamin biosynthesis Mg chelatase CobN
MSYLDENFGTDSINTGPHSMETYFAEAYITDNLYKATTLNKDNKKRVLKNADFDHYPNQAKPVIPPKDFINYSTRNKQSSSDGSSSDGSSSDGSSSDDESSSERLNINRHKKRANRRERLSRKKEKSGIASIFGELRLIDLFVILLIAVLITIQVRINLSLGALTNLNYRGHPPLYSAMPNFQMCAPQLPVVQPVEKDPAVALLYSDPKQP